MKSICVFGATGRVGGRLVRAAQSRGADVKAHCRNAASLRSSGEKLEIVEDPLKELAVLSRTGPEA